MFLLVLNNTNMPTPAPVNKPDINDPNVIALLKYNSVITTLDAQLGINPTKLDTKGPNIESFKNNVCKNSSPKKNKIVLINKDANKMNKNILNV